MQFSAKALAFFRRREYQGLDFEPDAHAMAGSLGSGRFAIIALRCQNGVVAEARYRTLNCISAIAAADWTCEWVRGRSLAAIETLTTDDILIALDGLPLSRHFCAQLVRDALIAAAELAQKKGRLS